MFQTHASDAFEDAGPHPGLKPQVTGAAGNVLPGHHLPLAGGPQDIENPVEHRAVRHARSAIVPGRLVGRQQRFDQIPQFIRNLAESVPLLGFSSHRKSSVTTRCFPRPSRRFGVRAFRTHSQLDFCHFYGVKTTLFHRDFECGRRTFATPMHLRGVSKPQTYLFSAVIQKIRSYEKGKSRAKLDFCPFPAPMRRGRGRTTARPG